MCQRGDRLLHDRAGVHGRLQRHLDQPETVPGVQVPPCLPAEHRGGVKQDDPLDLRFRAGLKGKPRASTQDVGWLARLRCRANSDPLRDLSFDLFSHGGEQTGQPAGTGPPAGSTPAIGPFVINYLGCGRSPWGPFCVTSS